MKRISKQTSFFTISILVLPFFGSCVGDSQDWDTPIRPEGWEAVSHSSAVDADYATVFPQDVVNRIDISISPQDWRAMLANMTDMLGQPGSSMVGGADVSGERGVSPADAACGGAAEGTPCSFDTPMGEKEGTCRMMAAALSCVPDTLTAFCEEFWSWRRASGFPEKRLQKESHEPEKDRGKKDG